MAVSTYWTWTKSTPQRKWFFWSNPYRIEVMIASLTEMLVTKLWSHDHIYIIIWTMWHNYVNNFMWTKIMTSLLLFQNTFVLRRPRVGIFADIIKIVTMFVKTVFKNSKKVLSCISSYSKISWFPVKKCWYQQNARGVSRDSYIYIYIASYGKVELPNFIIVWCVTGFRVGTFCSPPHPWAVPKRPILNGVKVLLLSVNT